MVTYHPHITPPAIHKISRDLARNLDDQQAAEALEELKDGTRVAEQTIPTTQGKGLYQALLTPKIFTPRARLVPCGDRGEGALNPAGVLRVDREAIQGPYQECGDDDPLGQADQVGEEPSHS